MASGLTTKQEQELLGAMITRTEQRVLKVLADGKHYDIDDLSIRLNLLGGVAIAAVRGLVADGKVVRESYMCWLAQPSEKDLTNRRVAEASA